MPDVHVILTNRFAKLYCEPEVQVALKEFFRYRKPGVEYSELYRIGAWDGYTNLLMRGTVGTGLFQHQLPSIRAAGFKVTIEDKRVSPMFKDIAYADNVRPYQQQAVTTMMAKAATGGLLIAATGSGKTLTVGEYLKRLKGPAVFVNDELALLEQSRKELAAVTGEEVGIAGRGKFEPQRITVATIQTLNRHRKNPALLPWLRSLVAIILDEFHVQLARRNLEVITSVKPQSVYGLTATLEMSKPEIWMPAMAIAGPSIFTYPLEQGVSEGYLAEGRACIVPHYCRTDSRDYESIIVRNKSRNDLIESLVRESVKRGRRAIVIVERILHYQLLSRRLADVPHGVVSGVVPVADRSQIKEQMESGAIQVIISSRVFAKGQSIRSLDTIIDATALQSADNTQQRYGRGTRMQEGKQLVYFDISDRGNAFARAAAQREQALRALKVPCVYVYGKDAASIYQQLGL